MRLDQIPDRAWKLLEQTDWCQGSAAKNAHGKVVEPTDIDARRFCTIGAINRVVAAHKHNYDDNGFHNRQMLRQAIVGMSIVEWNDSPEQTKENVINTLKRLDI